LALYSRASKLGKHPSGGSVIDPSLVPSAVASSSSESSGGSDALEDVEETDPRLDITGEGTGSSLSVSLQFLASSSLNARLSLMKSMFQLIIISVIASNHVSTYLRA
jgi:hypothetical protein